MLDLLHDPLIRVTDRSGSPAVLTLPGLMAALTRDGIRSVEAVQAHQRHAFHATLVQLAAIALHASGKTDLPSDEPDWAKLLEDSVPQAHRATAWHLVEPDLTKPAFMQPAVVGPTGNEKLYGGTSQLDMLQTSRSHDIKIGSGRGAPADEWLAALVSLQAQAGLTGPGNVGVARMNSGYGSRAAFGLVPPGGPGARFVRDVRIHLERRPAVVAAYPYKAAGGITHLWLQPWVGDAQLSLKDLDPYFVEVARRVRLQVDDDGRMSCRAWNNSKTRVAADSSKGNLGDLWTVLVEEKEGVKALTPHNSGLPYHRMVLFLLGGDSGSGAIRPSPLTAPHPSDPRAGMAFSARALVRGQGKTEGYHERTVPVAHAMAAGMGRPQGEPYGQLARGMVTMAGEMGNRCLGTALWKLANGGDSDIDYGDTGAEKLKDRWLASYQRSVDAIFFERLAGYVERLAAGEDRTALDVDWQVKIIRCASEALKGAIAEMTGKAVQRGRAVARAENALAATTWNRFPDACRRTYPRRDGKDAPAAAEDLDLMDHPEDKYMEAANG